MTNEIEPRAWDRMQALLPRLSREELSALKRSIDDHGIQNPILILPDGRIIDGHHRWLLCSNVPFRVVALEEEEAFTLGLALNLARRHLTPEQLRVIREDLGCSRQHRKAVALQLRLSGKTQEETAALVGVARSTVAAWELEAEPELPTPPDLRISVPAAERPRISDRIEDGETAEAVAADYHITPRRVSQIARMVKAAQIAPAPVATPGFPHKRYRTIVIDPPWPMKRVVVERFPEQAALLPYPTMTIEEIAALPIPHLADTRGCHVYLWTPPFFLPAALELFERWKVRYQCPLVWVKKHGFVPFSWKYDIELVLFGRIGTLPLEALGLRLSFEGDRGEHSTKPEAFYQDRVVLASPAPRLDMFARQGREGFEAWGAEAPATEGDGGAGPTSEGQHLWGEWHPLPPPVGWAPGPACIGPACPWHSVRGADGMLCEKPDGPSDQCETERSTDGP